MAGSNANNKLVLESRFEEVARAQNAILAAAAAHGFDRTQQFAIKLAIEEALTNAIKHGNHLNPSKQVVVKVHADDQEIRITVCDEGEGFRPTRVPDPTLDENLERPFGRGIMLMRAYMSDVQYNDAGNCVTMVKRRDCRLPGPSGP